MKKIIYGLLIALAFTACADSAATIDSKKLEGQYEVDLQPVLDRAVKEYAAGANDGLVAFGRDLASAVLPLVDLKVHFNENGEGVFEANRIAVSVLENYTDSELSKINKFSYKIEEDSVLYIRLHQAEDFNRIGVLRKVAGNYECLNLVVDGQVFNLIKNK